jgi:hypothetical protein
MNVKGRLSLLLAAGLGLGLLSVAGASDCVQIDIVDIGNPASEDGHALVGWGPIEPANTGGNYGGIDNCRVVYASEANGDGTDWATVDLDFGEDMQKMKCLSIHHLEGIAIDAFEVYVYPAGQPEDARLVFSFTGEEGTAEIWHTSKVSFPATGTCTVMFVSTGPLWGGWPTYGQIAIDEIAVKECDPIKDSVDIGDPSSEDGHNLQGWGPIEPANSGGNYGGVDDCRTIWAPCEYVDGQPSCNVEPSATIDLDFGECYGPKCLNLVHLEGIAVDAFDIFIYPPGEPEKSRLIYCYSGSEQTSELWHTRGVRVFASGIMTVKFHATQPAWSLWSTYGQVAFDSIVIQDWGEVNSFVDIGDPVSEAGHTLLGWGPIEPANSGGNYGGIDNCRTVYASAANGDGEPWATVDLDLGACACVQCVELHHLDGLVLNDAFDVFLYPCGCAEAAELVFTWPGDGLTSEVWYASTFPVQGTGVHTLEIVSTEPPWAQFDTYGQVCIDTIMVTPCEALTMAASVPILTLHSRPVLHLQPNPFYSRTALQMSLLDPSPVRFSIYDIQGRRVRSVTDRFFPAGEHKLIWDGRDAAGNPVAPGIYLYRVQLAGGPAMNGKVIHVR